jgi:hypothetical protein
MLTRLTHAGIAFALTVAAYQAYFLIAVPFVEPAGAAPVAQALALSQLPNNNATEKYREFLAAYFQPGHWTLDANFRPIVAENGQAMIVFDSYRQTESGALTVPRVVVLFFPHTRDRAAAPPRDAIILEPERGAMLQMDQTIDGAGAMGRMQYGQLLGAVQVHSDMREPGAQDDLAITTHDLYMNEDLIRTAESVEMALGAHRARGRGLEIRFSRAESSRGAAPTSLFGKLDTLEISHEVAARVAPQQTTLFGQPAEKTPGKPAASPAEITSAGPFRFDFTNHVASFAEQVRVRQRQPDGQLDQLKAELLTLYFAESRQWSGDAPAPSDATETGSTFGSIKLEPATIEATGAVGSPVDLTAPSHGAAAVGDRLIIELIQRLVTLEGGDKVKLTLRGAELSAPTIQYEMPPKDSTARIGALAARGRGELKAVPNPARPNEVIEVFWGDSMQLVRREGQPVLVLDGRPKVSMLGMGTLWADQLELYLREQPLASVPTAAPGAAPVNIEARRVVATGHVGIESAELNGHVSQLELEIAYPLAAPLAAAAGAPPLAATPAAPASKSAALFSPNRGTGGPRRIYNITGSTLHLDAVMRNRRPQMTAIHVDGGVVFEESLLQAGGQPPLRILAEHLQVTDADLPDAKIEIRGGDSRAGMAEITSGTTALRAPVLLINRGASEAWINSPGEVTMVAAASGGGQQFAAPGPVAITWRDSMHLKGDRIELLGNVHVQHADGWLRTHKLAIVLTAPVQFDGAGDGGRQPEVAQLECWEGAEAEFDQHDPAGALTSHQCIKVVSLVVNQVTGKIYGDGPGHVDSVHLSKHASAMMALPTTPGAPPPEPTVDPAAPPQLRHLSIDFVRGLEGNLLTRQITAIGDVRTVYGPVDAWDQRLTMTLDGRPAPDTIWITCERLTASENPYGRLQTPATPGQPRPLGPIDLKAEGGVEIELEHPEQGAINLRGQEATYDQLKTMFNLKGSRSAPAIISQQKFPGAPPSEQTAEGWTYFQNTGEIKINSPQGTFMQFDAPQ